MWWWWWCANFCVFSPCERSVCDNSNKDKHGGDSVRLVEELQADVVHRPLVDRDEVVRGVGAVLGTHTWGSFSLHRALGSPLKNTWNVTYFEK